MDSNQNQTQNQINPHALSPDSIVGVILGDTLSNFLFNPDSVTAAKIAVKTTTTRLSKATTFEKVSVNKILKGKKLQKLQSKFLANKSNYSNDSIIVMSPYIPAMEIDFYRDGKSVELIVSFSDHSWSLNKDGREISNFNYVSKKQLESIYKDL